MGIGFVLLLGLVPGIGTAAIAAFALRRSTAWLTRHANPEVEAARTRLIRNAYRLPFYALAWAGAVFAFQGLINTELLGRDFGAGDFAYCPLPNGYSIRFVDMLDKAWLTRSVPRRGSSGEGIEAVRMLQVSDSTLLGGSDTRWFEHLTQSDSPMDRYFLLDTRTGRRADFASEEQLRDSARTMRIVLMLEPVSAIYYRYRYTWFDRFAALLLLLPPLIACARDCSSRSCA